jgi:hypothetical protein
MADLRANFVLCASSHARLAKLKRFYNRFDESKLLSVSNAAIKMISKQRMLLDV